MSFDPQSIVTALESLTPTKYSWVAALTFMLYDHVTTLDVEVVNVWNRPRSLSKWVFIWTRYFGLASLIIVVTVLFHGSLSNKFCTVYNSWAVISVILFNFSVEAILLIRVYAVYDRNKYILYGLAGLLLLTITGTVILWLLYRSPVLGFPPIDGMTGCRTPTTSNLFGLFLIPPILNEVILCFFMLYKAWITYKNDYASRLLKLLIRDSVLYFSSIFVVMVTSLLVLAFAPRNVVQIGFGWSYAVPCTMGSRLLLSMLQEASREQTSAFQSDLRYVFSADMRMQDLSTTHVERHQ